MLYEFLCERCRTVDVKWIEYKVVHEPDRWPDCPAGHGKMRRYWSVQSAPRPAAMEKHYPYIDEHVQRSGEPIEVRSRGQRHDLMVENGARDHQISKEAAYRVKHAKDRVPRKESG